MIIPVILAGGSGTRLWPLSREQYPKQLLSLVDEKTMLQNTVLRLMSFPKVHAPMVICNDDHRFMVAEQLRAIGVSTAAIVLEPMGRNTAPALAVAAIKALEGGDDPVLMVLPADHNIEEVKALHQSIELGLGLCEKGYLITFGIVPQAPETGYGYIRKGKFISPETDSSAVAIAEFVEKPDMETARKYVASGNYCWNSGMFMFKASRVLGELERFVPDIVAACRAAVSKGRKDLDFFRLDKEAFAVCPSNSIDYAVMEKTDQGAMIPLSAGWNDLGSWDALWQVGGKDENGNVIHGDVLTHEVKHSYLHAETRMIAAVGLENHVVVETADAVLIAPRDRVQDVKRIVTQLKTVMREEASIHKKVYRPWGSYEGIDLSSNFQVKRITVKPGARLSLQKHFHRAEHWVVVRGTAIVTKGEKEFVLKEDESTYIPLGVVHRLENPGKIDLELIEVQSGSYLGEDDIVRFEDVYGR
ncbi:MAG: mannose-1-phosphate guanylyltransferase/mannose-6-phosphate isomerase [Proteobacteria bacterium]|nr:mannose-1-phosphate guanylyltransferase/mannose-6-phosphate isomerase [Pseudomonadota bacterium]